jgi:histidinol-phosphatase
MHDMSPELSIALDATRAAEAVVMRYYGFATPVRIKPDASPITQADIEAETVIADTILARFPDHRILTEERGDSGVRSDYAWIVDPIDGTKNFIRGIPFFGIQVALTRLGKPVVGVSSVPLLGERLYAETGCGAFLDGRHGPVRVSDVERVADAHISLGGLNHFLADAEAENVLRVAGSAGRVRGFGDAYAYHLVATGRCEAVLERRIRFWDIAALSLIVREAGGTCTDLQGGPVGEKTISVMCSNGRVHAELLALYGGPPVAGGNTR